MIFKPDYVLLCKCIICYDQFNIQTIFGCAVLHTLI